MSKNLVQRNKAVNPSPQALQVGGPGNDVFYVNDSNEVVLDSSSVDRDVAYASVNWVMTAGSRIEILSAVSQSATTPLQLTGNEFAQEIYGNAGANFIDGGGGADYLAGLTGNDVYVVDTASVISEAAGQGRDVAYVRSDYVLAAGAEVEILSALSQAATSALSLTGNGFGQEIYGNAGANFLDGGGGADYLAGLGGNDVYVVDAASVISEAAGQGRDVVYARTNYTLAAGAEVEILSVLSQAATTPLELIGNAFVQEIYGNAGANFIDGGGGADYLAGLGGNDVYVVDTASVISEAGGQGRDVAYARSNYVLAAGAEVEVLSALSQAATSALSLTGNGFGQEIYGNAGGNFIDGGGGADYLSGGAGNDIYVVDTGAVIAESVGGGRDVAYARSNFTLAAGAEVEVLSVLSQAATSPLQLIGNEFVNEIYGNAGGNFLDGGGGADYLSGAAGNDTYVVDAGAVIDEAIGGGRDVVYARANYALSAGAEVEVLSVLSQAATTPLQLTGNAFAQEIYGNAGANSLDGGGGNDTLSGLEGADILIGGAGSDVMVGGDGDDIYYVDEAGDVVIEGGEPGEGVLDIVYASSSYTLAAAAHVEILAAADSAGPAALNLTGNAFTQEIRGNAGANVLTLQGSGRSFVGGAGADTLISQGNGNRYLFDTALGNGNVDSIPNFDGKIVLDGNNGGPFSALASGQLVSSGFVVGADAADANDYLIYNPATGALLYDEDGNGAGVAVQFATIQTGLAGLNAGMFDVLGPVINHAPTMISSATASVAENSAAGTIVYQAAAFDADGDRVTFFLTGTDAALLEIDAATGAVRLKNPADFETKSSYSFTVWAADSSPNGQTNGGDHKNLTLTITNVPDNTPTPLLAETASANDSAATAQVIDRNTLAIGDSPNLPLGGVPSIIVQGNIATDSDRDFYAITLQAGELLILDVDNSSGNLDTYLRIYTPTGNTEIAANDDLGTADPGSAPHPDYGHNTDSFLRFRAPVAGTYYFSIESFADPQHPTSGSYDLNVSVAPPASAAEIFEEDIQALLGGSAWGHQGLSYGFPTAGNQYPPGIEETDQAGEFAPFTSAQQGATAQLLQMIANVTNLTFQLNGAEPGNADLRYAMSSEAEVAYAYYPTNGGPGSLGGSAWFNKVDFNDPIKGNYAWMGILHETGHALGLKHGHEDPAVNAVHDTLEYTVMTYRSHRFSPVTEEAGGYTNETWGYPQSLMMLDIAALQRLYGANFTYNSGDSVYSWNSQTAEMSINGAGQGAPGGQRLFLTVWDGGGNDTYDCSNLGEVTIDLRPGEWSTIARGWLANLGNGSVAAGNVANALLYNNDPRSLIENAIGGAGQDTLIGNQARNVLSGGGQIDTYRWDSVADCGLGSQADVVDDDQNSNRFDLALIDANINTAENDAFTFIGTGAFHNVAGELRYQIEGSAVRIQGDVDGNGIADLEIIVNHTQSLFAGEFFL